MPRPSTIAATAGRVTTATVAGRRAAPPPQTAATLPFKAVDHPRFLLSHRPECWDYYPQVERLLPRFSVLRLVPGIGRVDARGNADLALVELQKEGGRLIREQDVPDGYSREYDMLGGVGYLARWVSVRQAGKIADLDTDHAALAAFGDECLVLGLISPLVELVAVALRRKYEHAAGLVAHLAADGNASATREHALYQRAIAACDAALMAMRSEDVA